MLDNFPLMFEELPSHVGPRPQCEGTMPDGHECTKTATVEWKDNSEYSDPTEANPHSYYTYRCDSHPVKDPKFQAIEL
jgi:hypothetical protein